MFIVDVDGDRGPRRVAGAPNLYLSDYSSPRWADDGIALYVIGCDYQVWKIDRRNLTSTRLPTDTARKKLLRMGDASGSTIGSIDGGGAILVTTRIGRAEERRVGTECVRKCYDRRYPVKETKTQE